MESPLLTFRRLIVSLIACLDSWKIFYGQGRQPSRREAGTLFGEDVTTRFLNENNLDLLVRSHEVKMEGYDVQHNISCLFVFEVT